MLFEKSTNPNPQTKYWTALHLTHLTINVGFAVNKYLFIGYLYQSRKQIIVGIWHFRVLVGHIVFLTNNVKCKWLKKKNKTNFPQYAGQWKLIKLSNPTKRLVSLFNISLDIFNSVRPETNYLSFKQKHCNKTTTSWTSEKKNQVNAVWVYCSNMPSIPILHHLLQFEQQAGSSHCCLGKILPKDRVRTLWGQKIQRGQATKIPEEKKHEQL